MSENEIDNDNDNEIREVLGAAIGAEPPVGRGPAAVFDGARAHRARTRAVTGGLSMVAVLGIAAGAMAFSGGSGGARQAIYAVNQTKAASGGTSSSARAGAGAGAATPVPSASSVPAATTPPPNTTTPTPLSQIEGPGVGLHSSRTPAPQPGAGQVLFDGRSAIQIAKLLLPSGLVAANFGGQDSYEAAQDGVRGTGSMSVDDGAGKLTTVSAGLTQNNPAMFKVTDCATQQALVHGISSCLAVAEPDGSVVLSYRSDDYVAGANGPAEGSYSYAATRVFQNGWVVSAGASNYFDPLNDPHNQGWHVNPSRQAPLLSMDQVVAIVMDPRWGLTVPATFAQKARQELVPYIDLTQH